MSIRGERGFAYPYGVTQSPEGVNLNLYAPYANRITLHLFDDQRNPLQSFPLNPEINKTGSIWHILLKLERDSFLYGWEVENEHFAPLLKSSFEHLVLDPFGKEIASSFEWDDRARPYSPLSRHCQKEDFEWGDEKLPKIDLKNLIIYEMHVRGFTEDPSSQVAYRGKYLGIIEKIPYLKELGINAIELLPTFEFNEKEYRGIDPETNKMLCNYWGYSTVDFFSPNNRYAIHNAKKELKELVKAAHRAGIEVILDVVYNHTAEGGVAGPLYSLKALDPLTFYHTSSHREMQDFTGCGNSLNANHPFVRQWIMASLRHWVQEYHIDGFRFDLASIFYRGEYGAVLESPPLLEMMVNDPLLSQTKLIVEAWDAAGLYQVGHFYPSSKRFLEWNGTWRDGVRRFIRGDSGQKGNFATRLSGSQDLYGSRTPQNGINFVTCHDGFTLFDLVSYNEKHNLNNGEDNRDGTNSNDSWNCGHEGPTNDPSINELRIKQIKNFIVALFISQGIPMLHAGDEYGHTKQGNNNTWCQDNELNWFLWDEQEKDQVIFPFVKGMIELRKSYPHFRKTHFLTEEDIHWWGSTSDKPQWNLDNHFVAFILKDKEDPYPFYIAFNAGNKRITITLPKTDDVWQWCVNTAQDPPLDYFPNGTGPLQIAQTYPLPPYSCIILKATPKVTLD